MSALLVLVKTGMVFGLLALVLFVLKKTDGGRRTRGGLLEVRGTTRLGKGASLTVVRMDGKELLLGVTDHTVTLLTSEAAPVETAEPTRRTGLVDGLKAGLAKKSFTKDTHLAPEAVAAALAALRGETPPRATDGTVAATRTDARPAEEQPCADPAVA